MVLGGANEPQREFTAPIALALHPSDPGTDGILDLGVRTLAETLPIMHQLVERRIADDISDLLLVVRHPPVYTKGKGLQLSLRKHKPEVSAETLDVLRARLPHPVLNVERGGDVTYHDEGQFIGYPILKLRPELGCGLGEYLEALQELLMEVVRHVCPALQPRISPLSTGVWLGDKKIASIGVAVRRWVTFHGFALNRQTNLKNFQRIRPCGLESTVVENLANLAGREISHEEILEPIRTLFPRYFLQK